MEFLFTKIYITSCCSFCFSCVLKSKCLNSNNFFVSYEIDQREKESFFFLLFSFLIYLCILGSIGMFSCFLFLFISLFTRLRSIMSFFGFILHHDFYAGQYHTRKKEKEDFNSYTVQRKKVGSRSCRNL